MVQGVKQKTIRSSKRFLSQQNGQPLTDADKERLQIIADGRRLQLVNVLLQDTATYTCIASNPVGVADMQQYVKVIGKVRFVEMYLFCVLCMRLSLS